MKWKKYFFIAWAVIIAASIALAFNIHSSIIPLDISSQGLESMTLRSSKEVYSLDADSPYVDQNRSMQELYDSCDLAVKVTALDEREAKYESILTSVKVDEVYKGDAALKDKKIYVYEYAMIFMFDNEYVIDTYGGTYNIMNPGDQYYLLLDFNDMPEGYEYSAKDKSTYLISNLYYGKFSCEDASLTAFRAEEANQLPYNDVKKCAIIAKDSEEIQNYNLRRNDLLNIIEN